VEFYVIYLKTSFFKLHFNVVKCFQGYVVDFKANLLLQGKNSLWWVVFEHLGFHITPKKKKNQEPSSPMNELGVGSFGVRLSQCVANQVRHLPDTIFKKLSF
jgi:hypothetical protein